MKLRNPSPFPLADHPRSQVLQRHPTRRSTVFRVYLDPPALHLLRLEAELESQQGR
jgi:hypothetical protein